jgi:hypothetical protein
VITRQQAYACGISRSHLESRIRGGRWRRLYGRVYATFTGDLPRPALLWASLLRAGRGAVLTHHSAAEVQGLLDEPAAAVHLAIPTSRRVAPMPGVVVRRRADLSVVRHPTRLPPQTRIEETVVDLTQVAGSFDEAVGWLTRAVGRRLTTAARIRAVLTRRTRLRWRVELNAALTDVDDGCRSPLELRYLREVERRHGLPAGQRQAVRPRRGGRWYDDVRYRGYRTRVELDGRAAHPAERRGDDDRRDNAAVEAGETVLRYGWREVTAEACAVAAQVVTVLRRNGWSGEPVRCGPRCALPAPGSAS